MFLTIGDIEVLNVNYVPHPLGTTLGWTFNTATAKDIGVLPTTQELTCRTPKGFSILSTYLNLDDVGDNASNDSRGSDWLGDPLNFEESDIEWADLGKDEDCL